MPKPERTEPLDFVCEGFSLSVREPSGELVYAASATWDEKDGCFCLESDMSGNYDFAPVDLEELARILRSMPRDVPGE